MRQTRRTTREPDVEARKSRAQRRAQQREQAARRETAEARRESRQHERRAQRATEQAQRHAAARRSAEREAAESRRATAQAQREAAQARREAAEARRVPTYVVQPPPPQPTAPVYVVQQPPARQPSPVYYTTPQQPQPIIYGGQPPAPQPAVYRPPPIVDATTGRVLYEQGTGTFVIPPGQSVWVGGAKVTGPTQITYDQGVPTIGDAIQIEGQIVDHDTGTVLFDQDNGTFNLARGQVVIVGQMKVTGPGTVTYTNGVPSITALAVQLYRGTMIRRSEAEERALARERAEHEAERARYAKERAEYEAERARYAAQQEAAAAQRQRREAQGSSTQITDATTGAVLFDQPNGTFVVARGQVVRLGGMKHGNVTIGSMKVTGPSKITYTNGIPSVVPL